MNFDLRIPVGLMFTIFGFILVGVGIFGGSELVEKSLGINMNLGWGLFMTGFGILMLGFAIKTAKKNKASGNSETHSKK